MANIMRRPRVRSLVAATVVAGGLVLGTAAPAQAYVSPTYSTKVKCEAARPAYFSSWTAPGPCYKVGPTAFRFIVYTK
ncbi:hypothetical protein ACFHW0_26175 [Micromonospora sp. LOL_025]|uniref:hypothetical protein n=1 Tax=Micromonospora sp. LOL_025 TaxID=3345413 RepID=UPI003A882A30